MFASLPEAERTRTLQSLSSEQTIALQYEWRFWARRNQLQPGSLDASEPRCAWTYWLVRAGRGFGKTRIGAETIREWSETYRHIHLVGATAADTRDVMVQGESGLLNCFPPSRRPHYEPSKRLVTFRSGAQAHLFSADEPERLRGPQCDCFWADELAAWRFIDDAWDNLSFGFRLGDNPRGVITTTPKPLRLIKDLANDPNTVMTIASTYENRGNLAPAFVNSIIRKYEGTRLGRQELLAEILEDIPGALWTRGVIDATRVKTFNADEVVRVVVAIDPAVTHGENSDETGIIVAALMSNGHVMILDDLTCSESPLGWARIAIAAYNSRKADRIVGEVNNGGDLVEANIRAVAPNVSYRSVRASRGKALRAEPIAALYEQGRVHHVGMFGKLEDQMASFVPGDVCQDSPDRMDALVYAVAELAVSPEEQTHVREWTMPVQISRY